MKRFLILLRRIIFIGILIFAFLFVRGKWDKDRDIDLTEENYNSEYIYVLNRENHKGLAQKNYKSKAYPASLTKIMTTLVALEHIEDLSAIAPVDRDSYKDMVAHGASMAGFYSKEPTSYRDLLYGTILSSGGEAANSLAVNISGNIGDFVGLMNDKASELGLKDTHFTNPEGLHDSKQYTTAYDMALLLDYALENGDFRAIFTKESFQTTSTLDHPNGILLRSTVLSRLPGFSQNGFEILGGKSGTTNEAGQCWATFARKNNVEYIAIVMGSGLNNSPASKQGHIEDSIRLYESINE